MKRLIPLLLAGSLGCVEQPSLPEFCEVEEKGPQRIISQASALRRKGDFDLALAKLREAADKARQCQDPFQQARALGNIGYYLFKDRKHYDEGARWLEEALQLARGLGEHPRRDAVANTILLNLGICYTWLGKFQQSLEALEEATRYSGTRHNALGEMGVNHFFQEEWSTARRYLERALEAARESAESQKDARSRRDEERFAGLYAGNLAAVRIVSGDWDQAESANEEARRINRKLGANQLMVELRAADITLGRRSYREAIDLYEEVILKARQAGNPSLEALALSGQGLAFARISDRVRSEKSLRQSLDAIAAPRRRITADDDRMGVLSLQINYYHRYVDQLVRWGEHDRAFEVTESVRARELSRKLGAGEESSAGVDEIHAAAKASGTVLLAYWLSSSRAYLWAFAPQERRFLRLQTDSNELLGLVEEYQWQIDDRISDTLAEKSRAGRVLFEKLLAPARDLMPPGSRVVIAPHGPLHNLNFETLLVATEGRLSYWIEEATLSIAPSLSVMLRASLEPTPGRKALFIGDPEEVDPRFPKLELAGEEIRNSASRLKGWTADTFTGAEAHPQVLRSPALQLRDYSIIHFAAHAQANRQSPFDSSVVLSRAPGSEEHRLYTRDILEHELEADLVVLSACRSAGVKAYLGEGLVGFAWAFMRAGAANVVAGLRDLDDDSGMRLMEHFYAQLAEGTPPSQALRNSKLRIMKRGNYRKPYYWSALQVFTRRLESSPLSRDQLRTAR